MRSGERSIEQRPDTRICVVQRISDGMKKCEGDRCQRKSESVEKECRSSGGQTDMTYHRCTVRQTSFSGTPPLRSGASASASRALYNVS